MRNKFLTAIGAVGAVVALGSGVAHAEKWDMPMAYSATNFHSATGAEFAKCVTMGTGGSIEVVTHPSGSLFKGGDIKRAIQTGQAPIGERLLSGHQNENALFGFDSIPFLATSFDDSAKLWKAAKPTLTKLLDSQNLVLLYAVPWPPQGLYFKKEVNAVADMKGIKFRSYNTATARLAELTGMLPVTIEAAEISQAFATGVAESMVSSGSTGYDRKVWESLTHFYEVDAWLPRNYVMVNKDVWGGTSKANQNVLRGCASLAEYTGLYRSIEYTQFTLNGLKAGGMTVGPAGDKLVSDLKEIGKTMTTEWLAKSGAEGNAIVDAFKAMK
ncbi:MAG: TRAP transporter substrate-binding protein [Rhodospirillaceae bacterium]|jgi:TRAP-type C4-dicarboxylate transport system substrate-binding protein|nr:TRAP transporter substrate-binding protein [Rhodospirillaceae bacterium]MBT5245764.1 TRAP transporter substrate-binding protein [Rhodospirillaceae bacterium]MBT5561607.1 TRAP transporter substrate-binding protein [Rhodospirillaceae bacterium]MBT6241797.1 TRAP transporter substrate-binding protein [Rhodospirillaceae bacterium]MBT7136797.1 TRAP transporter substrate-binding protein [Rhodospirillaceae bacterium]